MAERQQPPAPTHRVYTVIKRDGQDDYWLNIGLAFPHKDGKGFNVVLVRGAGIVGHGAAA
jgi:hypothetical protein